MIQWRTIPGFDNYEASSDGRIRGARGVLSPWHRARNRSHRVDYKVGLYRDGKRHRVAVHRLVCLAFHGEPDGDHVVCHINHDTNDNRACNLRWGSQSDNVRESMSDDAIERLAVFEESIGVLCYNGPSHDAPF